MHLLTLFDALNTAGYVRRWHAKGASWAAHLPGRTGMWAGAVVTVCSAGIAVCGRARASNLPGRPACCSRSTSCR